MSELNAHIERAAAFQKPDQHASLIQDNANKTAFALGVMARIPQAPQPEPPAPKIPSLGALAVPN